MRRAFAVLGSIVFLFIAPGFIAGIVPRWITTGYAETAAWPLPFQAAGILLIVSGGCVLLDSFARFALQGLGTPAPVFPTRHLVVSGLYPYVRNPMYLAVVSVILGQGLLFGNVSVLEYGAAVWLGFHLFVLLYEEPTLRSTFGKEYDEFCANVHRWIPRFAPWKPGR
jgi:protein-S-isoprenylcysteine O-methyltransferase Ste14